MRLQASKAQNLLRNNTPSLEIETGAVSALLHSPEIEPSLMCNANTASVSSELVLVLEPFRSSICEQRHT